MAPTNGKRLGLVGDIGCFVREIVQKTNTMNSITPRWRRVAIVEFRRVNENFQGDMDSVFSGEDEF